MSLEFDATYRNGALHPDSPLGLPENMPVHVHLEAKPTDAASPGPGALPLTPSLPRVTVEEFKALVDRHSVSAPALPVDSRADIYSEHD